MPSTLLLLFVDQSHKFILIHFLSNRYNEFEPIDNFNSVQFEDGDEVLEYYSIDDDITVRNSFILLIYTAGFQILFGLVLYYWHTGLR